MVRLCPRGKRGGWGKAGGCAGLSREFYPASDSEKGKMAVGTAGLRSEEGCGRFEVEETSILASSGWRSWLSNEGLGAGL